MTEMGEVHSVLGLQASTATTPKFPCIFLEQSRLIIERKQWWVFIIFSQKYTAGLGELAPNKVYC